MSGRGCDCYKFSSELRMAEVPEIAGVSLFFSIDSCTDV